MGNEESRPLTDSERAILDQHHEIFTRFHRTPTQQNLDKLRKHDDLYIRSLGDKYCIYLKAICEKWYLGHFCSSDMNSHRQEVARLLDFKSELDATDLDKLWILYYATGDIKYSDRVKAAFDGRSYSDFPIHLAAKWSYQSHMEQGLLDD